MDFGLFFLMQRDEAWTERAVYESALEQMLAAEGLGYGSVWIAEHHFNDYGLCPAPPVLASYLAARTRTLRLGMGVSLLPLHHPVDLAEQLAVLDVVSGGRLDVGIGRGGIVVVERRVEPLNKREDLLMEFWIRQSCLLGEGYYSHATRKSCRGG
jgi:alkanesulfonate monooxygenase SsuD/methylene tetrahydromethanopterin reductase-like flavin-dependent oxidoreductase (luciferase family)